MNSLQLAERAGITYRQLDFWIRRGYVKVDNDVTGSGNTREFSSIEARVVLYMADLVRSGFTPQASAVTAREIAATGMARRGQFIIVAAQSGIDSAA